MASIIFVVVGLSITCVSFFPRLISHASFIHEDKPIIFLANTK